MQDISNVPPLVGGTAEGKALPQKHAPPPAQAHGSAGHGGVEALEDEEEEIVITARAASGHGAGPSRTRRRVLSEDDDDDDGGGPAGRGMAQQAQHAQQRTQHVGRTCDSDGDGYEDEIEDDGGGSVQPLFNIRGLARQDPRAVPQPSGLPQLVLPAMQPARRGLPQAQQLSGLTPGPAPRCSPAAAPLSGGPRCAGPASVGKAPLSLVVGQAHTPLGPSPPLHQHWTPGGRQPNSDPRMAPTGPASAPPPQQQQQQQCGGASLSSHPLSAGPAGGGSDGKPGFSSRLKHLLRPGAAPPGVGVGGQPAHASGVLWEQQGPPQQQLAQRQQQWPQQAQPPQQQQQHSVYDLRDDGDEDGGPQPQPQPGYNPAAPGGQQRSGHNGSGGAKQAAFSVSHNAAGRPVVCLISDDEDDECERQTVKSGGAGPSKSCAPHEGGRGLEGPLGAQQQYQQYQQLQQQRFQQQRQQQHGNGEAPIAQPPQQQQQSRGLAQGGGASAGAPAGATSQQPWWMLLDDFVPVEALAGGRDPR